MRTSQPRRHLVLSSESARHPFRASLPPHVFGLAPEQGPQDLRGWRLSRSDWRDIFGTWSATFLAVITFIS